jgi:hypothetical protein
VSLIRFEIRYADGRKEVANVDGERAVVGHGAHCDVRLPLDQAANEHVVVEVVGGTVRVETKAFAPAATVNGLPFTTIPLTADVPLKIGSTSIFISLGDHGFDGAPVVRKGESEETSPFMKVLGVGVLVAGAYMLFFMDDVVRSTQAPVKLPDLFAAPVTTCPQAAPDQALSLANARRDIAEGKRERSPFVAKDGLQAVQLYEQAAACYRQARQAGSAAEADRATAQLRASLVQDFRARRVRLEHLMAVGDYELAKNDVAVLRAMTEGKQGSWVTWLANANQLVKQKAVNHE